MPEYTDTELLDFLELLLSQKEYTGKCVLRMSARGRGLRLHETSRPDAKPSVREAILDYMKNNGKGVII